APSSGNVGTQINLNSVVMGASPPYTYAWTMAAPTGSSAVLSSTTVANPTFTPDISGNYILGLTVTDSVGRTASAPQATITVTISDTTSVSLNPSTVFTGEQTTATATVTNTITNTNPPGTVSWS